MLKPVAADILQGNSKRQITPEERGRYSYLKEVYTNRCLYDPCNRKLRNHLKWILSVLETGEINSYVAE